MVVPVGDFGESGCEEDGAFIVEEGGESKCESESTHSAVASMTFFSSRFFALFSRFKEMLLCNCRFSCCFVFVCVSVNSCVVMCVSVCFQMLLCVSVCACVFLCVCVCLFCLFCVYVCVGVSFCVFQCVSVFVCECLGVSV